MKNNINREKAIQLWDRVEIEALERHKEYDNDPMTKWIDPFRIFGDLYYVGDKVISIHLVDTGEGLILFDTGLPHTKEVLYKRITFLGFKLEDIRYIVHTHEHFDHLGATHELQSRYGCKTFIQQDGAETIRINPQHTEIQSSFAPDAALFEPDVELVDGDTISLGNLKIDCIHVPGHSAGTMTFLFDMAEGDQVLRVGLCGINGSLTLNSGRLLKYGIPLTVQDDYLASIEKIRPEIVDITLDTHPRPNGVIERRRQMLENPAVNPFIDRKAWGQTLDDYRDRFLKQLEQERGQVFF